MTWTSQPSRVDYNPVFINLKRVWLLCYVCLHNTEDCFQLTAGTPSQEFCSILWFPPLDVIPCYGKGRCGGQVFMWQLSGWLQSPLAQLHTTLSDLPREHKAPAAGARRPVTNLSAGGRSKVCFHKKLSIHFCTHCYAQRICVGWAAVRWFVSVQTLLSTRLSSLL